MLQPSFFSLFFLIFINLNNIKCLVLCLRVCLSCLFMNLFSESILESNFLKYLLIFFNWVVLIGMEIIILLLDDGLLFWNNVSVSVFCQQVSVIILAQMLKMILIWNRIRFEGIFVIGRNYFAISDFLKFIRILERCLFLTEWNPSIYLLVVLIL